MVVEHKLYLNSRIRFNDPYDSQPEIIDDLEPRQMRAYVREMLSNPWNPNRDLDFTSKILVLRERGATRLTKKHIANIKSGMRAHAKEYLDECGLASFSLTGEHPLLWAHYAASFSGICVVFRRSNALNSALCLSTRVKYVESRPQLPLSLIFQMVRTQRAGLPFDELANEIFFLSFLHKSQEWQYENEARIYYPFAASKKVLFAKSELDAILLGPSATPELEQRVRELIGSHSPTTAVHKASLRQNGYGVILPERFASAGAAAV
jgi:hypothetical protein